jgi:hypothetical protein
MNIRWELLGPPVDVGARFSEGMQHGRALRIQGRQDSALAAFARDPTNQSALAGLTAVNPELGMRVQRAALEREQITSRRTIGQQAARGDLAGARTAALTVGDMDYAKQLGEMSDDQRKQLGETATVLTPIYRQLAEMPYEERKPFLASIAPRLIARGIPENVIAGYDPSDANLQADIALGKKAGARDIVVIDGVAIDKATGEALFESPYPKVVSGAGGIHVQDRIGIGRGGAGAVPAARVVQGALPPGWEVIDDEEGGPSPAGSGTFP